MVENQSGGTSDQENIKVEISPEPIVDEKPLQLAETVQRSKKNRTPAQVKAFEKCRQRMAESRAAKKKLKKEEQAKVKEEKRQLRKKVTEVLKQSKRPQAADVDGAAAEHDSESESESVEEEVIVMPKKKKKPKKKIVRRVVYESSSEEEADDEYEQVEVEETQSYEAPTRPPTMRDFYRFSS